MNKKQILIVEDEIIIAEHIESNLKEFGYGICGRSSSGEKAIAFSLENKPDLILMDIRLQGSMDGIEAARIITESIMVPVIFLTAHVNKELLNRAKQVKPAGYLVKPIQTQMLNASIEIALHLANTDKQRRQAEQQLQNSQERWRSLTENSPDLVIELDHCHNILFLNRPIPGQEKESMIGHPLTDFFSLSEIDPDNTKSLQTALHAKELSILKMTHQSPDGKTIYYEARIVPRINKPSLENPGPIVTLRDLTSFRKISDKLLDRERWLRNTFQQAAVGIVHTDLEGRFIRVNRRYCDIVGCAESDLLGRHYQEITVPEFLAEQENARNKVIKGITSSFSVEKQNLRKDGTRVWVNLTLSLVKNQDGSPEYILGIVEDISKRKQFETALIESEQKYRDLVESIPQRVYFKNSNLTFVTVNQRLADDLDMQPADFEGKSDLELFPEPLARQFREYDETVMRTGCTMEHEEPYRIKEQDRIMASIRIPKRDGNGKIKGVLGVFTDITDRINSEKAVKTLERDLIQTQKMQALGTLAGGVAHDFNNVLHPIIGLSTLGSRQNEDGSSNHKYFSDINKAAKRAKELVAQILTFSRHSKQELRPGLLQPLIKEALKMLRASLPASIRIETDISADCGLVNSDPTHIHQIAMNLTTNAFQAMEEKGGVLSVSLQPIGNDPNRPPDPNRYPYGFACLKIADTGTGIPPEIIEKIFDPYFTTKDVEHGTGLGLSVVMGIVKAHDGTISVDSSPEKGTEFTVCLPIVRSLEQTAPQPTVVGNLSGNEHVLLVDDETDIVFFQSEALKQLGYTVTGITSSRKALEIFQADPTQFDAVVTDMTMPDLSGMDLSLKFLDIRPDLPIILCTGYSARVDATQAFTAGIRQFLKKPIDQDDLAAALRRALDNDEPGE